MATLMGTPRIHHLLDRVATDSDFRTRILEDSRALQKSLHLCESDWRHLVAAALLVEVEFAPDPFSPVEAVGGGATLR